MKILVTGATGFVGSHLCDSLTARGHEVYALIRSPAKAKEFGVPGHYIQGDLSQFDWVKNLPQDLDAVIHTAGIVHSFSKDDFFEVNAKATKQLLKALSHYTKLKFILVSSQAAGGPAELHQPANEESQAAVSHYGHSKLMAEAYAKDYADQFDLTIVRPPMVIGPRDPAMLDIFKIVNSRLVVSPGARPEKKTYSFVCAFDLVNFFVHALEENLTGTFYCAYPKALTLSDIIQTTENILAKKSLTFVIPPTLLKLAAHSVQFLGEKKLVQARLTSDKLKEILPSAWVCSSQKSIDAGYEYQWDLNRTIEATLKDYKDRRWL